VAAGLTKLREDDLVVGRPLMWNIYDSNGSKLVKAGFTIQSKEQVKWLMNRGAYNKPIEVSGPQLAARQTRKRVEKPKEISPFRVLEDVLSKLALTLASIESEEINFSEQIMGLVKDIQRACDKDANAAIASLFVLDGNSYPIKHLIDVAILVDILAKQQGIARAQRQSLVAAALTMNISIIELQEELCRQTSPLTEAQQKTIAEHPKKSVQMLMKANVVDKFWLKCVFAHHETVSGTGFPSGLKLGQYPEETQLITLADYYCSQLSEDADMDAMRHQSAIAKIKEEKNVLVTELVANQFLATLGFYPPGAVVQLANSEIGIVTKAGTNFKTPVVHVFMKPQIGNYGVPAKRNTAMNETFKIQNVISNDDSKITYDVRKVWGYSEVD
jgi:HD-GYP domain-containing protein (c-di-GMP phosphodiesterase class II)